jgi:hypothetical protein
MLVAVETHRSSSACRHAVALLLARPLFGGHTAWWYQLAGPTLGASRMVILIKEQARETSWCSRVYSSLTH